MALIAALLATLAAGLFTGAAIYITFVEHPARVSCGSVLAVTEFGPSYKRAAVMQALLAVIGAGAGIARWGAGGGLGWLVSSVVLGAGRAVHAGGHSPDEQSSTRRLAGQGVARGEALLARWGRLHAVR